MTWRSLTSAGPLATLLLACGSSSSPSSPEPTNGVDAADEAELATPGRDAGGPSDGSTPGDAALDQGSAPTADASGTTDAPADVVTEAGTMMSVYVTFYGWADNSPPGGAIAYPKSGGYPTVHELAGGTGTYADPITFATDKSELAVGTILYVPFIEKYVVMEDDCVECDSDWTSSRKWHIDLWMNSNGTESASALTTCEGNWTRSATAVEVNPPIGRTVTTRPLFDPSTNVCRTTP
jgi:hypothetical protein